MCFCTSICDFETILLYKNPSKTVCLVHDFTAKKRSNMHALGAKLTSFCRIPGKKSFRCFATENHGKTRIFGVPLKRGDKTQKINQFCCF